MLSLNPLSFPGGAALWGAVPGIYDTTRLPVDQGIHIHARSFGSAAKDIDRTFRAVTLIGDIFTNGRFLISELDAIYYMVSSVFGYKTKYVECSLCAYPHLDKDWFSVHSHQRHLCSGCGRTFRDSERAIGNPIAKITEIFTPATPQPHISTKTLDIRQAEYLGGLRIWGSNPAILWTANRAEEEGIHVHAFDGSGILPAIDDTFGSVRIDGVDLDPQMVRFYMAQCALPHLENRVKTIICPHCEATHFDTGELAFTPHIEHLCEQCGRRFVGQGRLRMVISNPVVSLIDRVGKLAPRAPRVHNMGLLPETI
jgi:transposase-like protein